MGTTMGRNLGATLGRTRYAARSLVDRYTVDLTCLHTDGGPA
jgi:hypothetical protein